MLYKESVEQPTLELLISLQQKSYLKGFHLVGGTALALYIGHRKSIDLDLFSNIDFEADQLLENLSADFPFNLFFSSKNTLKGSINQVQIDILAHRYPLINEPVIMDNVSMLSVEDIIAMKLNAIAISGQRVKDFIDIFFLLESFTVTQMVEFYKKKYSLYNEANVLKSLCWFEDVDISGWPILLKNSTLKWETIKKRLEKAVLGYLKDL